MRSQGVFCKLSEGAMHLIQSTCIRELPQNLDKTRGAIRRWRYMSVWLADTGDAFAVVKLIRPH